MRQPHHWLISIHNGKVILLLSSLQTVLYRLYYSSWMTLEDNVCNGSCLSALNFVYFLWLTVYFLLRFCPQMASATATYGQKESSDQNFDYMFKILIIGNSSVGKTSFLFRYADDSFTPAFVSTVGIDFKVKTIYRNDKRIKLQIWVRHLDYVI